MGAEPLYFTEHIEQESKSAGPSNVLLNVLRELQHLCLFFPAWRTSEFMC